MAYSENLQSITLKADASIGVYTGVPGMPGSASPNGGKQYTFVKVTGADTAGLADTTSGEQVVGVLQNKPQEVNAAATVAISGVTMVVLGGTVAAGGPVKTNATGKAVAGTPGTDTILGVVLRGGVSGNLVPMLLRVN